MKIAAELCAVAAAMAVALAVDLWALPWTERLKSKGTFTPYQSNKIWAIAVIGSGWITWMIVETLMLDWLK